MAEREEQKKQRNQQGELRSNQQATRLSETARRESGSQIDRRRGQFASPWGGHRFSRSFENEMERLFEDFMEFAGFGRSLPAIFGRREFSPRGLSEAPQSLWSPQVEIFERGGQFIIRADLPGLTKDDVKVDVRDDALVIQGERRQEHEEDEEGYYRSERSYGSFYRSIPLPEGVEDDDIKASFRDGVLEITMPAPQRQQQGRRIEIGEGTAGKERTRSSAHASGKS